ncbi:nucleotidyltransferase family protein [Acidobacterium sp. S8]|uniref:nucleotidyltransferase family protein n=1 Tax=Acidobacterium sp. S8 TaxID=1641854 RepID=UPI00131BA683|nr:nucleotidyltransferase family protein [Acidobacterium sp. S8]
MAVHPPKTAIELLHIPHEVRALLTALHLQKPDMTLLKSLSDDEWHSLLAFCDISHLTLPLALLPGNDFPHWVVKRLDTNLADNALRFESVKAIYREVADALAKAGVDHIVIKGFTQAPEYVAKPGFRAQSDIDIFCPRESIEAARTALQAIGYISDDKTTMSADHVSALVRLGSWQWRGNRFDPEMPLGIELHFCLWNEDVSLIRIPQVTRFWERRIMREVDGLSFPCLNPVDHLGHLALHILRNLFLHDWVVHHVRELAVFLHSHANNDAFWQSWSDTHSPSLRSFEVIAFYHAREWFGCQLHPQVEREIASLTAARQSWLRRFSGSALEVMFQENKDSLWLHLSLLSSCREKWKILRQALVPSRVLSFGSPSVRIRNKRLAPSSGNHPWREYIAYLLSRLAAHGRANLIAITRGLRWYLSLHHPFRPAAAIAEVRAADR